MNKIFNMDNRLALKRLPDNSVDLIVTSPPYYSLRDYGPETTAVWDDLGDCEHSWTRMATCSKCKAWRGQLGGEPNFLDFVRHLKEIFHECKRVLKLTGSLFLNIGDTYREKSRLMVPERLAISMTEDGWCLRNDIIWAKKNYKPQPVKDRLANSFEHIYFFVKSPEDYFFDVEPVKRLESYVGARIVFTDSKGTRIVFTDSKAESSKPGKTPRDVWNMATHHYPGHDAVFPLMLCYSPILACCPPDGVVMDPFGGSGTLAEAVEILNRTGTGHMPTRDEVMKMRKGDAHNPASKIRANRKWILVELSERFVNVEEERLRKYKPSYDIERPSQEPVTEPAYEAPTPEERRVGAEG